MSDYSNRLALWLNDKREQPKQPHLKGSGDTDVPVWVSAWFSEDISDEDKRTLQAILKRYDSKRPWLSISLKPKEERPSGGATVPPAADHELDFNDDVPF